MASRNRQSELEQERSLQQQLNARERYRLRLLGEQGQEEQVERVQTEIKTLLTRLQEVQGRIRARSPRYAALTQPEPFTVKEIQQQILDEDTLLLEYALGKERSYLWAVTPTSTESFDLPPKAEIETAARRVYDLLVARLDLAYQEEIAALSQMLLGPVADRLGKKRLLIVGDGAVQYLPFGALPKPAPRPRPQDARPQQSETSDQRPATDCGSRDRESPIGFGFGGIAPGTGRTEPGSQDGGRIGRSGV